jgi:hypothetical protein
MPLSMSQINMRQANSILRHLEPSLTARESGVREASPSLSDADLLEAALRAELKAGGYAVNVDTFEYLLTKVETNRALGAG